MTDITQLAKQVNAITRESDMHHAGSYTFSHEQLEQFASLLREEFIKELGEPVYLYAVPVDSLDADHDIFIVPTAIKKKHEYEAKGFTFKPLYALKDEWK